MARVSEPLDRASLNIMRLGGTSIPQWCTKSIWTFACCEFAGARNRIEAGCGFFKRIAMRVLEAI